MTTQNRQSDPVDTPRSGDEFAGVRLVRVIGEGGFGQVWLGVDGAGSYLAIKIVSRGRGGGGAIDRERRAAKLLRDSIAAHPHLLTIHHVGASEDFFYYTMDLADPEVGSNPPGSPQYRPTTLQSLLSGGVQISVEDAAEVTRSILAGLAHLHAAGVIHRDVKPGNVLRVGGQWMLADFGVASTDQAGLTTVGTLGYLSPNGKLGPSSDLFAAGKILYCLVTGNKVEDFPSIASLAHDPVDRVRRWQLIRVVNRACAHNHEDRYKNAEDFAKDFERAVDIQRVRRNKKIRAAVAGASVLGLAAWVTHRSFQPVPLTVGDIVTTVTQPSDFFQKPGGKLVRFEITHDQVWKKSEGGNGHRYLAFRRVEDVDGWGFGEASEIAERFGGYLVSIETMKENSWLFMEIASDPQLWQTQVRQAPEWQDDPAVSMPPFSPKAIEFLEKYGDSLKARWGDSLIPKPAGHGPMIGMQPTGMGKDLVWASGVSVDNFQAPWPPTQPYFEPGEMSIAFGFGNMESDSPVSSWYRRNYCNDVYENRWWNTTISFIVEVPK